MATFSLILPRIYIYYYYNGAKAVLLAGIEGLHVEDEQIYISNGTRGSSKGSLPSLNGVSSAPTPVARL